VRGDFTGDGILDLYTNGSILYGRSDGTFSTPEPIGSNLGGGTAGDFNGDGWLDLAAFNSNGGVSVLINDRSWTGPPPTLTIGDVAVTEGHTGTVAANFAVTLSSNPTEPVTVSYTTLDWSATTADGDYQGKSGTLTFNPGGPLTQTITVQVNGDRHGEIGDQFFVIITSADAPVIDGDGIATIIEDEPTLYMLNGPSAFEGNSGTTPLVFTLTLSAPYDVPITVRYATQDGSATSADADYQATTGTATIAAGATTTTVTINVNGDVKIEGDESFLLTLSNASSAYVPDYGRATGTILDDESRISISDVTKSEGKKGKTTLFTFTVTLSAASSQQVTMSYRTANGTATTTNGDYIAKTGTLTFAPGETVKTITIEVKGDHKRETNETFYLDLFKLSSNALFTKNRGVGTILNDD
jgi:hypothetical protein